MSTMQDMTKGGAAGHLLRYAVPLMLGNWFQLAYNAVDSIIAGRFIGKDALVAAGKPTRVRVGLAVTGRGIVREHQDVFLGDEKIGMTTSGTHCPFLGKAVAMAMLDAKHAEVGTKLEVEVRGRRVAVEIIPLPFYTRPKKK